MKKLINDVATVLSDSLDGFAAAHGDLIALGGERKFLRRKSLKRGKPALISGGGSGHEPLHGGFVGHGMLDAACPGQVFTSPTPDQMLAAADQRGFQAKEMGLRMQGSAPAMVRKVVAANVVARVEGSDPKLKDEAVVFSAPDRSVSASCAACSA